MNFNEMDGCFQRRTVATDNLQIRIALVLSLLLVSLEMSSRWEHSAVFGNKLVGLHHKIPSKGKLVKIVIVYEQEEIHYGAYLPDFPGCVATGKSLDEVRENIRSAILMHFPTLGVDPRRLASQQVIVAEIHEIPDDRLTSQ